MRIVILACALLLAASSCCKKKSNAETSPAPSAKPTGTKQSERSLERVTAESMAARAKKAGFKLREEMVERTELPGGTIYRLTLDHGSRGTAFVDYYDMSNVASHKSKPAIEVGPHKTLYVSVDGGTITSSDLLAKLTAKAPLATMKRTTLEAMLKVDGWTLGDSNKIKDDISGHEITDFSARKNSSDLMVVLLDYASVAKGKEQSAMVWNGRRLLFVDMEKRRWSESLIEKLTQ